MARILASEAPLTVQAIAGTYVVLFGIDYDEQHIAGSHGFGIERLDHTEGEQRWLPNNLRFAAVSGSADPHINSQWGTNFNPLQTFLWGDYTAKPDHDYTYIVHCLDGTPGTELTTRNSVSIRIRTEHEATEGVWFNRGAISSQAYAGRFKNKAPKDVPNNEAWRWLSRGLEEALLAFIGQAVDNSWQLHGSFYEFQQPEVLTAFGVAAKAGANVQLIVDDNNPKNHDAVDATAIGGLIARWRKNATIPHNKFIVASKDGTPVSIWTGSTNVTANGIFGQSNVGHSVKDAHIASQYLDYWNQLVADPPYSTLNDWVDANNPIPADWPTGTTVVFSPHTKPTSLDRYAELFGNAGTLACGTFPFNLDSRFGHLLPGDHSALRYLLFEDVADAKAADTVVKDPKTTIVAGAFLPEGALAGWATELKNPLSNNIEYIHTKFLLIDPLGDDPIIVTGSANFSVNSTTRNDENMLVIRGEKTISDIYLTEFMRLFQHYRFRYFLQLSPHAKTPGPANGTDAKTPLDITDGWWAKYYTDKGRARQRVVMSGQ